MDSIDWRQLLVDNNIPFVEKGKNVAKGNYNIACPFCGSSDPSHHMGINIQTGAWGCWRNSEHRGNKPHRLISAMLGCSFDAADDFVRQYTKLDFSLDSNDLTGSLELIFKNKGKEKETVSSGVLSLPEEFLMLGNGLMSSFSFRNYLQNRGFSDVYKLADRYNLRYAIQGEYRDRIIVPLYSKGKLMCWTGRTIKNMDLRYKTLNKEHGAIKTLKNFVFEPRDIYKGGKALFITEGPFDAIKVDYYGQELGVRATCLFGLSYTDEQIWALRDLIPFYKKAYIMMDSGAETVGMRLLSELSDLSNIALFDVSSYADDPGNLTKEQVIAIAGEC